MKQFFKSIYFTDYPSPDSKSKSVTLAFSEPEVECYRIVKNLSSEEIRELIGVHNYEQLHLFAEQEERSINQLIKLRIKKSLEKIEDLSATDVTFVGSKKIPFQRWYPFIEGYSPDFVKHVITNYCDSPEVVLDPFAGTGTTVFAADSLGISSYYCEINPLLQFLIQAKLEILGTPFDHRLQLAGRLEELIHDIEEDIPSIPLDKRLAQNYSKVFGASRYFHDDTLDTVLRLSSYINEIRIREGDLVADVLAVAVLSSLIPISLLKKAGDVRFRTPQEMEKSPPERIEEFIPNKLFQIIEDIRNETFQLNTDHSFILSNAKNLSMIKNMNIDCVVTSPPYLNGTNYFRNTKLELWFLKYLQSKSDLRLFRDQTLTCGINDVSRNNKYFRLNSNVTEDSPILRSCLSLLTEKSYDNRIPVMVHSYFAEMSSIFSALRKHLSVDCKIVIDVGDSIFANVHVQTDNILTELLRPLGYSLLEKKLLRKRRSRNKAVLSQVLLVFGFKPPKPFFALKSFHNPWEIHWHCFKNNLPHQGSPFSKRNWGHPNHSLCSYQGKLKPSIAHHLVKVFVPDRGSVLDPFCGVGTIPFEAALAGKMSYGIDISLPAYYISSAKTGNVHKSECEEFITEISEYISTNSVNKGELAEAQQFGFNRKLNEYYHRDTFNEILLARRFFAEHPPMNGSQMLVFASLLHILHGNRPYALSRRSHPIVPYAPTGDFIYKNLVTHLRNKVERTIANKVPHTFKSGKMFLQDSTSLWPQEINNLDAIVTSPPFYDSTRFYSANWIRIWFSGWSTCDFKYRISSFIEEKQKKDFSVYESIFRQARERLKPGGVFVLHLGKSHKCDMAAELARVGSKWFSVIDQFDESVEHCESHGIKDKGAVTSHQYLILQ